MKIISYQKCQGTTASLELILAGTSNIQYFWPRWTHEMCHYQPSFAIVTPPANLCLPLSAVKTPIRSFLITHHWPLRAAYRCNFATSIDHHLPSTAANWTIINRHWPLLTAFQYNHCQPYIWMFVIVTTIHGVIFLYTTNRCTQLFTHFLHHQYPINWPSVLPLYIHHELALINHWLTIDVPPMKHIPAVDAKYIIHQWTVGHPLTNRSLSIN